MPKQFFVQILSALTAGLLLGSVAVAADGPPGDPQPSAREAKPSVQAVLQVSAVEPSIWPLKEKKFDRAEFQFYKQNLAAWLKSPVVLNKALAERSVLALPLVKQHQIDLNSWLASELEIGFPGDAEVMTISMKADDRDQAIQLVNSVVSAFLKEVVDKQRTDKLIQRDNLDRKFRAYKNQLFEKQRQEYELEQELGGPESREISQIKRQVADLQQLAKEARRAAIQAELKVVLANKRAESRTATAAETKSARDESETAHTEQIFWETKAAELVTEAGKLEEQSEKKRKFRGDFDQLQSEIDQLKDTIREMDATLTHWNIELDAEPRVRAIQMAE